jgi:medium-chain acyl-[acyl-carrier-protein] hydrolase
MEKKSEASLPDRSREMGTFTKNVWFDIEQVPASTRLIAVCFPHAGGSSAVFGPWRRRVPDNVLLLPVRLPGREQRLAEPLSTSIAPLVAEIGQQLSNLARFPLVLIGHSFGALLAFELARWRRKNGQTTRGILAAGCPAPQFVPRNVARRPALHQLPDDELIFQVQRRYGGLPDAAARNAELMALLLPVVRADIRLVETYEYQVEPPLECPIWAFGGSEDREVPLADLAGWREQTSATFSQRLFNGGHFFLGPALSAIVELLRQQAETIHPTSASADPS